MRRQGSPVDRGDDVAPVLALSPVGQAGGAEHLLVRNLVALRGLGHDVTLLVCGPGPLPALARGAGLHVEVLPDLRLASLGTARVARQVRRHVRGAGPGTALLLNHPKAHLLAVLAGATAGHTCVLQLHDPAVTTNAVDRLSAALPVRRVANTDVTARAYERSARLHRTQQQPSGIPVIRPGLDVAAYRRSAQATLSGADRFDRPDLLMVGRLQSYKGQRTLLEIVRRLVPEWPDLTAVLVGPDAPSEPGLRTALLREVHESGLSHNVLLLDYLGAELPALVKAATLLVHPARQETFGLVLVEAMAVGTPVVAFAGTGPSEILAQGGGVLLEPGDVAGMTQAVSDLLREPAAVAALGRQAEEQALRFDVDQSARGYERLLFPLGSDQP